MPWHVDDILDFKMLKGCTDIWQPSMSSTTCILYLVYLLHANVQNILHSARVLQRCEPPAHVNLMGSVPKLLGTVENADLG